MKHQFALCVQIEASEDGPPGSIHLLPAGPLVRGRDGREWRMTSPENVAARLEDKIAIDINHSTQRKSAMGDEAPAVGWITALESRESGIWGTTEWNSRGKAALNDKEYRFISPVFTFDPDENNPDTGEIDQLLTAALTNNPNLRLTALNTPEVVLEPENKTIIKETINETKSQGENMDRVKGYLSLKAEATEDDIVQAIEIAINERQVDTEKRISLDSVPREQFEKVCNDLSKANDELEEIKLKEKGAEIEAFLKEARESGKIVPASEDKFRALCNVEGGLDHARGILDAMPVTVKMEPKKELDGAPPFVGVSLTAKDEQVLNTMTEPQKAAYKAMKERMVAAGQIRGA